VVLERIRRKSIREAEAVAAEYQRSCHFPKESVENNGEDGCLRRRRRRAFRGTSHRWVKSTSAAAVKNHPVSRNRHLNPRKECSSKTGVVWSRPRRDDLQSSCAIARAGQRARLRINAGAQDMGMPGTAAQDRRCATNIKAEWDPHWRVQCAAKRLPEKPVQKEKVPQALPRHIPPPCETMCMCATVDASTLDTMANAQLARHGSRLITVSGCARKGAATIRNLCDYSAPNTTGWKWSKLTGHTDVLRESFACTPPCSRAPE
jgi:hypothetical protein